VPAPEEATIIIGGDVIEYTVERPDEHFVGLVGNMAGLLPMMRGADAVLFNAEAGLCDPYELDLAKRAAFNFYMKPESVLALRDELPGTELILGQANNHTMNFGEECRQHGFDVLKAEGIHLVGAGDTVEEAQAPYRARLGSTEVAVLAYAGTQIIATEYIASNSRPGIYPMREEKLIADLAAIPEEVYTIVFFHAAFEYAYTPNGSEIDFARAAARNGADLVVGHGPHVIQWPTVISGVPVFYSLGNALMDMCLEDVLKSSVWLEVQLSEGRATDIIMHPFYAENCMFPEPLDMEWVYPGP
jgi:poly-gamma-glutamate synthesis protein (capsule biosynthesis protein)